MAIIIYKVNRLDRVALVQNDAITKTRTWHLDGHGTYANLHAWTCLILAWIN